MAKTSNERNHRRGGGGGKLLGLGFLGGLVALLIAYLRGCIPGLGAGDSSSPATEAPAKAEPAEAEPAEPDAPTALALTVDGDRCRRGDEPAMPCDKLCRALGTENKARKVEVHGTLGTHAAVDALRKCLGAQGFRDVVVRAE